MKYEDIRKVIGYVFAEFGMPDVPVSMLWHRQLTDLDFKEAMLAADKMLQERIYGTPKISDFFAALKTLRKANAPKELTMPPDEAVFSKGPIAIAARKKAGQLAPKLSDKAQFNSVAELDRESRINRQHRIKTFKGIFADMQARALQQIEAGQSPELAIAEVTGKVKMLHSPEKMQQVKNILEGVK